MAINFPLLTTPKTWPALIWSNQSEIDSAGQTGQVAPFLDGTDKASSPAITRRPKRKAPTGNVCRNVPKDKKDSCQKECGPMKNNAERNECIEGYRQGLK